MYCRLLHRSRVEIDAGLLRACGLQWIVERPEQRRMLCVPPRRQLTAEDREKVVIIPDDANHNRGAAPAVQHGY